MAKSFHELSPRTQLVVFALLSALMAGAAWQMVLGPGQARDCHRTRPAGDARGRPGARAGRRRAAARRRNAKCGRLKPPLRETEAVIPEEKDPQDVLRNLHEMASESLLDIASFKPKSGRGQDAVHGMAHRTRHRGQLSRPRSILRPHRRHAAPDVGLRPADQDEDQGERARHDCRDAAWRRPSCSRKPWLHPSQQHSAGGRQ